MRSYFGGPSETNADLTVFLETPNSRAIALIGNPSARCSLRISAQSSTDNTPHSSGSTASQTQRPGGQNSDAAQGSGFTCRRQQQVPIVRKGNVAGAFNTDEQRGWYVNALANPGFSGGPLVFQQIRKRGEFAIAGLVRGSLMAPVTEPTDDDPKPMQIPSGLSQVTDARHIHDLGFRNRGPAPT